MRFIPACAGNILLDPVERGASTVHPRVCGEHAPNWDRVCSIVGSSPRVRGTFEGVGVGRQLQRFIPACAGNINDDFCLHDGIPVHPRVCGEHVHAYKGAHFATGSSPRVRGTSLGRRRGLGFDRFIPACAGNMPVITRPSAVAPVHPRVCGEHAENHDNLSEAIGSSPRVRGTSRPGLGEPPRSRFIPACAGNICSCREGEYRGAVHPRVCGEHARWRRLGLFFFGSSPRVRGTSHTAGRR